MSEVAFLLQAPYHGMPLSSRPDIGPQKFELLGRGKGANLGGGAVPNILSTRVWKNWIYIRQSMLSKYTAKTHLVFIIFQQKRDKTFGVLNLGKWVSRTIYMFQLSLFIFFIISRWKLFHFYIWLLYISLYIWQTCRCGTPSGWRSRWRWWCLPTARSCWLKQSCSRWSMWTFTFVQGTASKNSILDYQFTKILRKVVILATQRSLGRKKLEIPAHPKENVAKGLPCGHAIDSDFAQQNSHHWEHVICSVICRYCKVFDIFWWLILDKGAVWCA